MRFTSLAVELIRARPLLVFWIAVLIQAALWLVIPLAFYTSPPGDVAAVLAIGREYQLGSVMGPPLAFWLADLAYRLAGSHLAGVYLLAQLCFVVTLWAVFALARAMVGAQQAVLAVLLTITITAFSFPGVEFGPAILARPLWALTLWHAWQALAQSRRRAWFALSFDLGLLLLTTTLAPLLIALLVLFAVSVRATRRALISFDALFALIVVGVLLTPYAVWLGRADANAVWPQLPDLAQLGDHLMTWPALLGGLLLTASGLALLIVFNSARFGAGGEEAPIILRAPLDPLARRYIYFVAIAPLLIASLLTAALGQPRVIGGAGVLLAPVGLAAVVAAGDIIHLRRQRLLRTVWACVIVLPALFVIAVSVIQPWISAAEVKTLLPGREIGRFFGEGFERRTGQPLTAVAGDADIAAIIGYAAAGRPHLLRDAEPETTPWFTAEDFARSGGVVVWRASDTGGAVPGELLNRFPGLTPEVPRAFERRVQGRQQLLRIGWAIVRPGNAASSIAAPGSTAR